MNLDANDSSLFLFHFFGNVMIFGNCSPASCNTQLCDISKLLAVCILKNSHEKK